MLMTDGDNDNDAEDTGGAVGGEGAVCDGTQNVKRYRYFYPVPNIFNTDTGTFFGTKFSRYRFRDFFPILNFNDTGSETFSGTKF